MRGLTEYRVVLSLAVSAAMGAVGLHVYPFPSDHVVLALVRLERPLVYAGFAYTYAALWVSSSFYLASVGLSCLYIFVPRDGRSASMGPIPPYPAPEHRPDLFVVLGEQHRRSTPERATTPTWLTIPERGLYTARSSPVRSDWARPRPACIPMWNSSSPIGLGIRCARRPGWSWRSKATSVGKSATS